LATESIEVGTGIAYAFTRKPLAMAALARDVQRLSGGRFSLGISSGTRGVRRWYDAEFDPPAPAIEAYVGALRQAWSADTEPPGAPPPVYGAVLNPIMTRYVARSCDGALLHALAIGRVHLRERLLPALREGAAGRDAPLTVVAWCITSIDDDEEQARARARAQLAFYLSTPSYRTVAEGTDWESVPTAVRDAFDESGRKASWDELGWLIPDALVDELTLAGTPTSIRVRAQALEAELADDGVHEIVFQTVGAGLDEAELVSNCRQIINVLGPRAASGV
jgi:alkanesulfonate monooxygenase SsuD/methylene tetrahydromethanopterin reductase-like flavin-dependent oxidoreductase (luciferase family)